MHVVSAARTLVSALALAGLVGLSGHARADFLYGRLTPQGGEADANSSSVDVSADGRTVVFSSDSKMWVGDTYNGTRALAVDLDTGVIDVMSLDGSGVFRGVAPAVSGDGRYVIFLTYSNATYGPNWQVLRKDRQTGAVEVASTNASGQPASGGVEDNTASISADGRYVAFQSTSPNLPAAQPNPASGGMAPTGSSGEIYVKDMVSGQVKVASLKNDGSSSGDTCALLPHGLSGNGRHVAMLCGAAMVAGATSGQAYVRDLQANTTELISRSASAPNGTSTFANRLAISPSGRFVSFQMRGYGGLGYVNGVDSSDNSGVYVRDRQTGTTTPIPRPTLLPASEYDSCSVTAISDVASVVLACLNDWAGAGRYSQVFLYVPGAGAPELISPAAGTTQGSNGSAGTTLAVNASGLSMAWESNASNADANDHNGSTDIYVLVEESVISDVIFANGFDTAPVLRPEAGQHTVAIASVLPVGAARD
jgi:hypothetical protein